MTSDSSPNTQSFHALGIAPDILTILESKKLTIPTPIQQQSIPPGLEGKDLVGIAQTGTGKTFAFGIPMIQKLLQNPGRGLVIVPTRELAYQVEQSLKIFTQPLGIKTAVMIGGVHIRLQKNMIRQNPRILIATPGRLNDHLDQGTITLKEVSVLVLDEADRMFDMGFRPQLETILSRVPKERQTLLFSATMPPEILKLAHREMHLPLRIEVAPAGTAVEAIKQELFILRRDEKLPTLLSILSKHSGSVLVFSRTKHGAKKINKVIRDNGHTAAELHANKSLSQRKEALEGFKRGKYRILVATDIAARGIDVANIELVINFDLPDDPSDYVHRIGRTARAGRDGRAISFATGDQRKIINSIERLIRKTLPTTTSPSADREGSVGPSRPAYGRGRPTGGRGGFKGRKQFGRRKPRR